MTKISHQSVLGEFDRVSKPLSTYIFLIISLTKFEFLWFYTTDYMAPWKIIEMKIDGEKVAFIVGKWKKAQASLGTIIVKNKKVKTGKVTINAYDTLL